MKSCLEDDRRDRDCSRRGAGTGRAQRVCDDARMGGAHRGAGRRQGDDLHGDQRAAGRRITSRPSRASSPARAARISSSPPAPSSRSAGCRWSRSRPAIRRSSPASPGYFEAASYVTLLEKPARLDRSEGDVHPGGNPHIQTDPRNIASRRRVRSPRGLPSSTPPTPRTTRRATRRSPSAGARRSRTGKSRRRRSRARRSSSSTRRSPISRSGSGSMKSRHSSPSPASSRRPRISPKSSRRCNGSR